MTVLVTGGAGYIGSHTALALRESGRKVVVLDNLSRSIKSRVPRGVEFERGDISDSNLVARIIRKHKVTAILHFAAFIKVEESVSKPELYFDNNTRRSRVLMEIARAEGVKTFIFSSSAAVYGNPDCVPVAEDGPLSPINPYGESKAASEKDLGYIFKGDRLRHASLRYFNVAGADQQGRCGYALEDAPSHLIRMALAVARGKLEKLLIFGTDYPTPDGTCVRDYIHVVDLAAVHVETLRYLEKGNDSITFNCGYGHGASVLEVVKSVRRVTGKNIPVEMVGRRPGDPASLVAECSLIKKKLGWEPKFDNLDTIVSDQYQWEQSFVEAPK